MKSPWRTSIAIAPVLAASVLLAARQSFAQLPTDPVERAKAVAQIIQVNARQLTVFDRDGKEVAKIGTRDMYGQPLLSPDGTRVAVLKTDVDQESQDVWILDAATGKGTRITTSKRRDFAANPVWSPDGNQVAYVALRDGYFGLYRKASNGQGSDELLYRASAPLTLTDWSMDGRFLTYFSTDLSGGKLFALPLDASGERKPIEVFRSASQLQGPRLSPDSRLALYISNESGRNEAYVRVFDPAGVARAAPKAWQVSDEGGQGMVYWRRDGKELYYLAANRALMAVAVTTANGIEFGRPRQLFHPPDATPMAGGTASITRDGERIVFAVPLTQLRQITVLDRAGNVIGKPGAPGVYVQPGFSPDGTRVVVMKNDPQTSNQDIATIDLASGKTTAITNDMPPENAPIWSPDSKYVAYVSTRGNYAGIYRKASDGTGEEELLFRYTPGAGMVLTDWSRDGKFLAFDTGVLLLVPLVPDVKGLDRKAIEWLRADYDAVQGRFSPDGRYIAYLSNEADGEKMQVYVRPFDAAKPEEPPPGTPVQISKARWA